MGRNGTKDGKKNQGTKDGKKWYLFPKDLIDGRRFFECIFSNDSCSLFLHVQHECIQWFLYVGHVITIVTAHTTSIIVNVTQVTDNTVGVAVMRMVVMMATRRSRRRIAALVQMIESVVIVVVVI